MFYLHYICMQRGARPYSCWLGELQRRLAHQFQHGTHHAATNGHHSLRVSWTQDRHSPSSPRDNAINGTIGVGKLGFTVGKKSYNFLTLVTIVTFAKILQIDEK